MEHFLLPVFNFQRTQRYLSLKVRRSSHKEGVRFASKGKFDIIQSKLISLSKKREVVIEMHAFTILSIDLLIKIT